MYSGKRVWRCSIRSSTIVQQVRLQAYSSRVPGSILSSGYCLCVGVTCALCVDYLWVLCFPPTWTKWLLWMCACCPVMDRCVLVFLKFLGSTITLTSIEWELNIGRKYSSYFQCTQFEIHKVMHSSLALKGKVLSSNPNSTKKHMTSTMNKGFCCIINKTLTPFFIALCLEDPQSFGKHVLTWCSSDTHQIKHVHNFKTHLAENNCYLNCK